MNSRDQIPKQVLEIESLAQNNSELAHSQAVTFYKTFIESSDVDSTYKFGVTLLDKSLLFNANQLCRLLLDKKPNDLKFLHLLATVNKRAGFKGVAVDLLIRFLDQNPNHAPIRLELGHLLFEVGNYTAALSQANILLDDEANNSNYLTLQSMCQVKLGNFDDAINVYKKLLEIHPNKAQVNLRYANALKTKGELSQALATYKNALIDDRFKAEAYWNLSNLKTYKFTDAEVFDVKQLQASASLSILDEIYLNFTLANIHEENSDYKAAFDSYSLANKRNKENIFYNSEETTKRFEHNKTFFTQDYFNNVSLGSIDDSAIFILGLPRSGSTLLEQILSAHSQVDATMELTEISSMVSSLNAIQADGKVGNYPNVISTLDSVELENFGAEYIKRTKNYRKKAKYFIDKTPANFEHIGLIKTILPNAKIIDARRNPMACGFSIYKQFFASGFRFANDLSDIGKYYRDYQDLMGHWNQVLPGQIHTVNYDLVITDFKNQVNLLLDFCGLEFEPECLAFHESKRAVATISSEQVRQPIYKSGLDAWKNYAEFLAPLKQALDN